jgi:hypothetical protein
MYAQLGTSKKRYEIAPLLPNTEIITLQTNDASNLQKIQFSYFKRPDHSRTKNYASFENQTNAGAHPAHLGMSESAIL